MGGWHTHAIWTVKEGREAEFVAAWKRMGEATLGEFPAARGTLLQDAENPSRFVSFGPWESREQIGAWRASAAFQDGVAEIRRLLEDFEPGTFETRLEVARPAGTRESEAG